MYIFLGNLVIHTTKKILTILIHYCQLIYVTRHHTNKTSKRYNKKQPI
jgi:hypothetical protein